MTTRRTFLHTALATTLVAGCAPVKNPLQEINTSALPQLPTGTPSMDAHLTIGAIIYPRMDQIDFTGPFEVLSQLPNSTVHILAKDAAPIRDYHGLVLTPDLSLAQCPPLDLLIIPGGPGQQDLMEDDQTLSFIRAQAARAQCVFSVCTGALLCGAAGLLVGKKATTHWGSFHLLPYFGAIPTQNRVVTDGKLITAAGVTAGIDGALLVAALLRGPDVAQQIQLGIEYTPEPLFHAGTPASAPPAILQSVTQKTAGLTTARLATAQRIATKLGLPLPPAALPH